MRRSLGLGLLLVTACRAGLKAPETILVPPGVLVPLPPAIALPAADTSARPGAEVVAGRALIAPDWPLTQRVRSVAAEHAMVVTSHRLACEVGVGICGWGGDEVVGGGGVALG